MSEKETSTLRQGEPTAAKSTTRQEEPNTVKTTPPPPKPVVLPPTPEVSPPKTARDARRLEALLRRRRTHLTNLRAAAALRERYAALEPPQLALDTLIVCADGALIAGFLETSYLAPFGTLRSASTEVGAAVLGGELTSRPKRLNGIPTRRIHAP